MAPRSSPPLACAASLATLDLYRRRYVEAQPEGSVEVQEADAAKLFAVLAGIGGEALVGPAKTLPPGTFYTAAP